MQVSPTHTILYLYHEMEQWCIQIFHVQNNKFIELTLSTGVRGITVWSVNVIDLPQNGTMIYPVQSDGFIKLTLSIGARGITVWPVNVIDLP